MNVCTCVCIFVFMYEYVCVYVCINKSDLETKVSESFRIEKKLIFLIFATLF